MTQILITNGGPHPADKWAVTTAAAIIDHADLQGDKLIAAERLKFEVAAKLEAHHKINQELERNRLSRDPARLNEPYTVASTSTDALADVIDATKQTQWAEHFAQAEIQEVLQQIIAKDFCTAQLIERQWFEAAHPDSEHAETFRHSPIDRGII